MHLSSKQPYEIGATIFLLLQRKQHKAQKAQVT